MKKLSLLLIGAASVMACGMVVGVAANSTKTNNIVEIDAANAESEGKFNHDVEGAHLPGNSVYFIPESSVSWWTKGAETRVYFQNNDNSYYAWSDVMVYAYDRGNNSNKPVYEVKVPEFPENSGLTAWTKFQVIRGVTGKTPTTIDDQYNEYTNPNGYIYNYSGSCDIYWDAAYHNTIGYYDDGGQHNYCLTISAVERLEVLSWNQNWSKPAGSNPGFCQADGSTDTSTLHVQWEATGSIFDGLGEDVQYYFSHVTAVADDGNNTEADVPDFAARYDWVFYRYSDTCTLRNWADRTINF